MCLYSVSLSKAERWDELLGKAEEVVTRPGTHRRLPGNPLQPTVQRRATRDALTRDSGSYFVLASPIRVATPRAWARHDGAMGDSGGQTGQSVIQGIDKLPLHLHDLPQRHALTWACRGRCP